MKILITGATGLVGKEIVAQCLAKHLEVHYLTTSRAKIKNHKNYQGFYWNPSKGEIDTACFNGVSAIINLAGSSIAVRWNLKNKQQILESRINSLATLKKGLEKKGTTGITSFVSASAIGIYPNSYSNYYKEEEKDIDVSFLGEVVEKWEKEIDTFGGFNFSVSKIRIGLVFSKDGGALPKIHSAVNNFVGAAFGSGKQWQSWIHCADLAAMFLFVMEHNLKGVFNGVSPNPVTNKNLVTEMAKTLRRPLWLPNIPQTIMKIVLGEMSYLLFASQKVSCEKIQDAGFVFLYSNLNKALKEIYIGSTIDA